MTRQACTGVCLMAYASRDHLEVSDEALESSRKVGRQAAYGPDMTLQLLRDVLSLLSGRDVEELEATPDDKEAKGRSTLTTT